MAQFFLSKYEFAVGAVVEVAEVADEVQYFEIEMTI